MPYIHYHKSTKQRLYITLTLLALILSLGLSTVQPAFASSKADVINDEPTLDFPNEITFQATISADNDITSIVLEYGMERLTCGDVIAKAYPQFNPGKSVNVAWTWDMRQSGSLPPGATIWWRWHYTDASGKESVTDQKSIIWLDDVHLWETISDGQLSLHYYDINKTDAQDMLNAGIQGLQRDNSQMGLSVKDPIDIYVYPNYQDMRDAILFEPAWSGGLTIPGYNIVALGTSSSNAAWNQGTVIHELTHVLVNHITFSCLSYVPRWLDEGLAVYSEGPLDPQFQVPFDQAIQDNSLLSVRVISNAFAETRGTVDLSYAQSFSLVNFLIDTYGKDKMTELLTALHDGATTDEALTQTYGFNIDGFEDAWRQSIGAQPRTTSAPTAQPTPTFVPTIMPISGAPLANQITTPSPVPTSSVGGESETQTPVRGKPPLSLTIALLGFCCIFIVIIGVLVLGFFLRRENRKRGNNEK